MKLGEEKPQHPAQVGCDCGSLWWPLLVKVAGILVSVCVCELLSRVQLFVTPWTAAHQVPLSMEFSRQEYWSGLPFPSPGDLPNPGIEPRSPTLQADSLPSEPPGKPINKVHLGFINPLLW